MSDPRKPGTASAPPVLGEGCVQRYDPEALSEEHGTEFPGAAELWNELQQDEGPAAPAPGKPASR